jgi:ribulose-bisphosphate carboxylase small chain
MRLTQGTFSFLPDLSDEQIRAQVEYCLRNDWAISIESTNDPHPRNTYWTMWGLPMFDSHHSDAIMQEIKNCREAHPRDYIRVNAFDSTRGWETVRLSFIVNRPEVEPGFDLVREEAKGRTIRYTLKRRLRSEGR